MSAAFTDAKACRAALWLALLHAQQLGWTDLTDALMVMLRTVDQRRVNLDEADRTDGITP